MIPIRNRLASNEARRNGEAPKIYRNYAIATRGTAVISHGIVKEGIVPPREIDLAVERKRRFAADPAKHTFREG